MSFEYICEDPNNVECAEQCIGLDACEECACAVLEENGSGPWGNFMDLFFCLLPILFLVMVTIKPNPMPTTKSLPTAAVMMYLVRLMYLGSDPLQTNAAVILGFHEAITPLSIMAGAIALFESMEATYCLPYMMREMKALTEGHPIADSMLIFCFAYMVEGASGFGTPVALGAPMLVSSGHGKMESVVMLLVMNTFATVWGAVGTPIWFGFAGLVPEEEFIDISYKAAIALCFGAFILMPFVLTILVPWPLVKQNLVFVYASLCTCIGPAVGLSFASYEFPSLLGGLIGCGGTALLISKKVGLSEKIVEDAEEESQENAEEESPEAPVAAAKDENDTNVGDSGDETEEVAIDPSPEKDHVSVSMTSGAVSSFQDDLDAHIGPRDKVGVAYLKEMTLRTFPIWGVVILLILTRVEPVGLKELLTKTEPNFTINFGTYGTFRLSASLVFSLSNILTYPGLNWKYEFLYIPFFVPFTLISLVTMVIFRKDLKCGPGEIARTVGGRLANPAIAMMGALSLVQLLIVLDQVAPAFILGSILADWFRQAFIVICPLLGALGSFFSGSTTVSNLTFGDIQVIAAESIGTSETTMLALQVVGASAGNGICLNNIIAACAVVGLNVGEGKILMQTYKFVFANTTIATGVMLAFFFRFNG